MKIQNEEAVSPGKAVTTEDAVSPVIGVILMVAITVILAAVIAAFVFGLAGTTGSSKNVGLTVTKNGTDAFDITVQGGTDLPSVTDLTCAFGNNTFKQPTGYTTGVAPVVGAQYTYVVGSTNTGSNFIIKATFNDGSEQVLFDKAF